MALTGIFTETTAGKIFCDTRLRGDAMTWPLKWCLRFISQASSAQSSPVGWGARALRVVTTAAVCAVSVPAGLCATLGMVVKWVNLSWRMDKLAQKSPAIGYSLPLLLEMNSRLGDRLVTYLHAKCLALRWNIPVYFRPFSGAEFFQFSQEEGLTQNIENPLYFKRIIHLTSRQEIEQIDLGTKGGSVLYVLDFFPDSRVETEGPYCTYVRYSPEWTIPEPDMKRLLQVITPYKQISIPNRAFSIAVHIRTGGHYDDPDTKTLLPAKLPPLSYYSGELRQLLLSEHIPANRPLFIHLFTDALDPQRVCKQLQEEVGVEWEKPRQQVTWSYIQNSCLKDDVANMTRFECLIRPDSHLSGTLAKTAQFKVEIFPTHFVVDRMWRQITIDQVVEVRAEGEERRTTAYEMPVVRRWPLPCWFYRLFHRKMVGVDSHMRHLQNSPTR